MGGNPFESATWKEAMSGGVLFQGVNFWSFWRILSLWCLIDRSHANLPNHGGMYFQPLPGEARHYKTEVIQLVNGSLTDIEQGSSMQSSNTLIQDSGYYLLVDTPSATDISSKEQMLRGLSDAKIFPGQVQFVLNTHGHPDHMGQANFFPNARHFFASYEYTGNNYIRTELYTTKNFMLWNTPGHTNQDISAVVLNVAGRGTIAVVGDLFYSRSDAETNGTDWNKDAWNPIVGYRNRRKVICEANWIVPGHSAMFEVIPSMRQLYNCPAKVASMLSPPPQFQPSILPDVLENRIQQPVATPFHATLHSLNPYANKDTKAVIQIPNLLNDDKSTATMVIPDAPTLKPKWANPNPYSSFGNQETMHEANSVALVPCLNPSMMGKLQQSPAGPLSSLYSSLSSHTSDQLAYVLSPPAIAAVQEPCTGKIHHLPVYPIQMSHSDVSSLLLPVMESAAKNIAHYLNAAQMPISSPSSSQPQVLPPAPHIQHDEPNPNIDSSTKSVLNPKLAASYAEMIHKAFHKFANENPNFGELDTLIIKTPDELQAPKMTSY